MKSAVLQKSILLSKWKLSFAFNMESKRYLAPKTEPGEYHDRFALWVISELNFQNNNNNSY